VVRPRKTDQHLLLRNVTDDQGGIEVSDPKGNWRPDPDVITQLVEGETVLVHLQTNEIYALNPTATRAWDLLAAGSTRNEVEEALLQEFDVPPDQVRDEMDTLIAELVEKKLLLAGN
jgi:Coenzyme PQQ synthesis protein D (PqqD)